MNAIRDRVEIVETTATTDGGDPMLCVAALGFACATACNSWRRGHGAGSCVPR